MYLMQEEVCELLYIGALGVVSCRTVIVRCYILLHFMRQIYIQGPGHS